MHSVRIEKQPPHPQKGKTVQDGTRKYLDYYGLLADRIKWLVKSDSDSMPEKNIRRYIARIIDPLGFNGYTDTVKEIENQLEQIFDEGDGWNGEPFKLKVIVKDSGSNGGIISSSSTSELMVFGGCGERAGTIDTPYVTIPSDKSLEDRRTVEDWVQKFNYVYSEVENGDMFEVRFEPSDTGLFDVAFNFESG